MRLRDVEAFVEVNGASLWTATRGSGHPALLVHGGPGICDYLAPVADMLDDIATVHRYEQRGCGRSPEVEPINIDTLVADIDALRVAWAHERWTLIGHSWGATLAFLYAIAHPERVTKLVYLSGVGITEEWMPEFRRNRQGRLTERERARWGEVGRRIDSGDNDPSLVNEWAEFLVRTDFADPSRLSRAPRPFFAFPANQRVNARLNADWTTLVESGALRGQARALPVSTLVLHGAGDPRPSWPARELAGLIPGARFITLDDVGHEPFWERPEPLREHLRGFLA
jgi:proline iminopeptidase